jgi:hypothetical protein
MLHKKNSKKNAEKYKSIANESYYECAFKMLREYFPNLSEKQYRQVYSKIQGLLVTKIYDLTKNKSYVSYRNNGRFLRDFAYICDFLKSEQETDEDSYKKILSERERKTSDGQSCI